MEVKNQSRNTVPGYGPGFEKRFQVVIDAIGGQNECSEITNVTRGQVRKWRDGTSKIPLIAAGKLCDAAGVSLDWLYSGKAIDDERHDKIEAKRPTVAELGARLRRSREVCEEAIQVAGWEPPRMLYEMLRTIIFTYDMKFEDVVLILDAARPDREDS